jgi:hypothetical protein
MLLTEAMRHPAGFVQHPAFQVDGAPLYDNSQVYFYGISQGAIYGGALLAVAPNLNRAALNVPGMNFSLLMRRSVNFDFFLSVAFQPAYPSILDQTLGISLAQMLWDRSETNGYANHLTTDTLPGSTAKKVLLDVAFADHSVTGISSEVEARTIGAAVHQPATVPGRHNDIAPDYAIEPITAYPYDGLAMLVWDIGPKPAGNPPPPLRWEVKRRVTNERCLALRGQPDKTKHDPVSIDSSSYS